ncbi:hypothetical protein CYMTET_31636 [Cymbomonas tetramitiformis]|uniref:Uncharacterized protein n=1 Tax=Cymbomonas tetramitiformis TaxID=36881 RepID=A0AAE0FGF3_9CHLO|nr:hypothetical protein CYMTET_31636 [Cymbomonas tetramitiformis]
MTTSPPVVIFDCDGTLLDTEPAYLEAESAIAARHGGVTLEKFKTVVPRLLGTVPLDSARIVIEEFQLPITPEQYLSERDELTSKLFPHVGILPGCERLVTHLQSCGIPFGIATSSSRKMFLLKMKNKQEWLHTFKAVVTGDDVAHGKPHPEIFEKAARALGSDPGPHCIVFEDAPAGIQAGRAAGGMRCVGLVNEFTNRSLYQDAGAEILLSSMEEFLTSDCLEQFGLPPFPS